jgi:hypothetical protein
MQFTGRREPISMSGAGKAACVILRTRPCSFGAVVTLPCELWKSSQVEPISSQAKPAIVEKYEANSGSGRLNDRHKSLQPGFAKQK